MKIKQSTNVTVDLSNFFAVVKTEIKFNLLFVVKEFSFNKGEADFEAVASWHEDLLKEWGIDINHPLREEANECYAEIVLAMTQASDEMDSVEVFLNISDLKQIVDIHDNNLLEFTLETNHAFYNKCYFNLDDGELHFETSMLPEQQESAWHEILELVCQSDAYKQFYKEWGF